MNYRQETWYGIDHYVCLLCGWDSTVLAMLDAHLQGTHQQVREEPPQVYVSEP